MAPPRSTLPPRSAHRERLTVSVSLWLLAIAFSATLVIAVGLYLTMWFGLGTAVLCALAVGALFGGWGSPVVEVDERGLRAGHSLVEWPWVARVEPLDQVALRREMGPGAMATAHLLTRPYIPGAVKVVLDDAADPHPYWIVSTRHPDEVAEAASAQLAARGRA